MTRKITIRLLLLCAALLIGWDVYAEGKGEPNTISAVLRVWAKKCPILAAAFGVLLGHWFRT